MASTRIWATGNDIYTLADASGPGVYHQAIWDAGGIDQIVYARRAGRDDRPAPGDASL
jgi:hypothetical protein